METSSWLNSAMMPINIYVFRPVMATLFVFSIIFIGWYMAWKLVLVHVPLVQEIFGLRKKPFKPKPQSTHRLSKLYNSSFHSPSPPN